MPNFEESASRKGSSYNNDYSYSKILAFVNGSSDASPMGRSNRVNVVFKDTDSYNRNLREMDQDQYKQSAGCDLSAIFMPFQSKGGVSGSLPGFNRTIPEKNYAKINIHSLLPFQYASGVNSTLQDKWLAPSGDSINGLITSDKFYSDVDRYRDLDNVRGVGLRLPIMGVGWGYTTKEEAWPSGAPPAGQTPGVHYPSGSKFFKGGKLEGTEVDPSDYIAAPMDFRYNKAKNVWTMGDRGFWAQLGAGNWVKSPEFSGPGSSGLAWNWQELKPSTSGIYTIKSPSEGGRFGNLNKTIDFTSKQASLGPAYEVNNINAAIAGTKVWLEPEEEKDFFAFTWHLPKGRLRYQVLQVIDDNGTIDYDFPKFY